SISGTVTDASGAVVPNAQVTVLNTATSVTRTLVTNDSGFYNAPNLLPGPYQVKTSASGFATMVERLELTVGAEAVVNVQLKAGEVTEVVQIGGGASVIEQASSTLSAAVQGKTIRELPLNGRDWSMLAKLEPKVHTVDTQVTVPIGQTDSAKRDLGNTQAVDDAGTQR